MANEIFRKPTVRHSSTNFFSGAEIFARIFFREHDSEPESARLSSVKDVTATGTVQPCMHFAKNEVVMFASRLGNTSHMSTWSIPLRRQCDLYPACSTVTDAGSAFATGFRPVRSCWICFQRCWSRGTRFGSGSEGKPCTTSHAFFMSS